MNYVCGLVISKDLNKILLIKKNRGPECVIGKLNFIGGKVEEKDLFPLNAISRECKEETNLDFHPAEWTYFCEINLGENKIYLYYIITNKIFNYKQIEDEELKIYSLNYNEDYSSTGYHFYQEYSRIADLDWLISMALNYYNKLDFTKSFTVIKNS